MALNYQFNTIIRTFAFAWVLVWASPLLPATALAGAQTRVALSEPITVSEPRFSAVTGAVRFPNGSIVVGDPVEREVVLVEKNGRARVLGRTGSGPGEYRQPQRLLPFRSSSALMIDPALNRVTTIDSTGRFVSAVGFPDGLGAFALPGVRSVDYSGRMVFGVPMIGSRPGEVPVFLWKWPDGSLQPVDTIKGAKLADGGAGMVRIVPFSHADEVALLTDGTRVTLRASTRTIEWIGPNGGVTRRPLPGEETDIPSTVRERIRPVELQREVGRTYPPFDASTILVSSANRVWFRSLPARGDSTAWYGFSATEKQPYVLMLDRTSLLITVQEPYAILIRTMNDDTERIEVRRFR